MERESENIEPRDSGGKNTRVKQNRAVVMGVGMGLGKRWLSKIEVVCSGNQHRKLFKNEMTVC